MKAMKRNTIRPTKNPAKPVASVTPKVAAEKIPPKNSDTSVSPEAIIPMIPKITA